MIYIFDDRAQRRSYNLERLNGFLDLLEFKTVNIIPGKPVEDCLIDDIKAPDCIIFHKSYVFMDQNISFDTIRQLFMDLNIPIVIFSGGIEGSNKSSKEININADLMYANLPFFLEDFRKNGVINIDTLLWGREYRLNAALQFQNKFSIEYLINQDPKEEITSLESVKRKIENGCRNISKELGDAIKADIDKCDRITWIEVARIIDYNIRIRF